MILELLLFNMESKDVLPHTVKISGAGSMTVLTIYN